VIPRSEEDLKEAVQKSAIALVEVRENAPRQLQQQEINLSKQRIAHDEKVKKLERLRQDRKWLKITAPRSGFVYYGGSKRGKWSDAGSLAASLTPGGSARPKSVLMTIVEPAPLKLRVSVAEDVVRQVKSGDKYQVKSIAFPDETIEGTIESLSSIPISEGVFDAIVALDVGKLQGRVMPGMKGSITLNPGSPSPPSDAK
jgi:multidrug resistance efflux pump